MNARIDPERLSAYVDGELAPEEMAQVAARLATSPEDRAIVDRLRQLNAALAAAYDAPHRAPLPPALHRVLASGSGRPRPGRWWAATGLGMAASLVAVAMFLGLRPSVPSGELAPGRLNPGSALHALLESEPSGGTATFGSRAATLLSTFLDGDERPCREVEVIDAAAGSLTRAVACRSNASWTVEFAISAVHESTGSRDFFVPASGAEDAAFGAALDALEAGPVIGPAEEEDLIERDWGLR